MNLTVHHYARAYELSADDLHTIATRLLESNSFLPDPPAPLITQFPWLNNFQSIPCQDLTYTVVHLETMENFRQRIVFTSKLVIRCNNCSYTHLTRISQLHRGWNCRVCRGVKKQEARRTGSLTGIYYSRETKLTKLDRARITAEIEMYGTVNGAKVKINHGTMAAWLVGCNCASCVKKYQDVLEVKRGKYVSRKVRWGKE